MDHEHCRLGHEEYCASCFGSGRHVLYINKTADKKRIAELLGEKEGALESPSYLSSSTCR